MDTPVLAVRHVSKSFAGVRALVDIDLEIAPGEIHCLAGENGSGKSTLIKVISGVHTPEHGTVSIDGRDFTRLTPAAAIDAGVRVIYQDFSIFPNLSVMENIALGSEVAAGRRLVNRSRMREVAREAVAKIGFDVDLDELVGNLSVADKQLVAISRALMGDAKLIIMDEPTTALTKKEVSALFDIVRDLHPEASRSSSCPTSSRRSSRSRSASRSCAPATRSSPARRRTSTARSSPAT